MRRRQAHPERETKVGTRGTGALGQPENETIVQRKTYMHIITRRSRTNSDSAY